MKSTTFFITAVIAFWFVGSVPAGAFCGDGAVDGGETCDDGNTNDIILYTLIYIIIYIL